MLPDTLKDMPTPAALEAWDPTCMLGGRNELGECLLFVAPHRIVPACLHLRDALGFERLVGISCIDRYPVEPRFEVLYLFHSISRNERIKFKVILESDNPEVESLTPHWPGAEWYERETFDLFGIRFLNHPDLRRIMMPDDWQGHPLRRDFPVHGHKYSYQDQ
jgi:NADH-quinone oxidoreductase subunit C